MSKKHIAPQLPLPGVPAAKPSARTIAFQVTAEEWKVLEAFSQSQYRGLVHSDVCGLRICFGRLRR